MWLSATLAEAGATCERRLRGQGPITKHMHGCPGGTPKAATRRGQGTWLISRT